MNTKSKVVRQEEIQELFDLATTPLSTRRDEGGRHKIRKVLGSLAPMLFAARYFFWAMAVMMRNEVSYDRARRRYDCRHKNCMAGEEFCPRQVKRIYASITKAIPYFGANGYRLVNQWTAEQSVNMIESIAEWYHQSEMFEWKPYLELKFFFQHYSGLLYQMLQHQCHISKQIAPPHYFKLLNAAEIITAPLEMVWTVYFPALTYVCTSCGDRGHHWKELCPTSSSHSNWFKPIEAKTTAQYFTYFMGQQIVEHFVLWKRISDLVINQLLYFTYTKRSRWTPHQRRKMTPALLQQLNKMWQASLQVDFNERDTVIREQTLARFDKFLDAAREISYSIHHYDWPVGQELHAALHYAHEIIIQLIIRAIISMSHHNRKKWLKPMQAMLLGWCQLFNNQLDPSNVLVSVLPHYYEYFGMYGLYPIDKMYSAGNNLGDTETVQQQMTLVTAANADNTNQEPESDVTWDEVINEVSYYTRTVMTNRVNNLLEQLRIATTDVKSITEQLHDVKLHIQGLNDAVSQLAAGQR